MVCFVRLRVEVDVPGRWRLALGSPGGAFVDGRVRAPDLDALTSPVARLVSLPNDEARQQAREEEAGRRLSRALMEAPALWGRLWELLGEARARGEVAMIVVDAADPVARAAPWELLAEDASGPALWSRPDGPLVARLGPGQAARAPGPGRGLRCLLWSLDEQDPAIAQAQARRRDLMARLGVPVVSLSARSPAPPDEGALDVLHVLAHGEREAEQVWMMGEQGPLPPGAPAAALLDLLPRARLVVLEVCHAARTETRWEGLVERLLAAGASQIIAPRERCLVETMDALAEGLYPALLAGRGLGAGLREGWSAVARRSLVAPGARWWILQLHLGWMDERVEMTLRAPALAGWPAHRAPVEAVLARALALAERAGPGFLGLEQIAAALLEQPGAGALARIRPLLSALEPDLRAQLSALMPGPGAEAPLRPTPRLARLGARLGLGADLDALIEAIAEEEGPLLGLQGALAPSSSDATALSGQSAHLARPRPPNPPLALEILGGPEDGRRLTMAPGQTLGRWDPGSAAPPDHALYQDTRVVDRHLSKRHLIWLGPGRVTLLRPADRERWGQRARLPPGEHVLALGDLLTLGRATRLIATN